MKRYLNLLLFPSIVGILIVVIVVLLYTNNSTKEQVAINTIEQTAIDSCDFRALDLDSVVSITTYAIESTSNFVLMVDGSEIFIEDRIATSLRNRLMNRNKITFSILTNSDGEEEIIRN